MRSGWTPRCVYTNTAPSGSYRAFGASHVQWVGELQVDEVARRAGLDAVEIRRRNLLHPGEQVRPGGKPLDADLVGDVEKVAAALGWDDAEGPGHRAGPVGGAARGGRPPGVSPRWCGWRPTARPSCSWAPPRWARASGPRSPRSRRRCWAWTRSASGAWARTPASRPTTAPRAPAARRRSRGWRSSAPRSRCATTCSPSPRPSGPTRRGDIKLADGRGLVGRRAAHLPGAHREALRAVRRPAHRRGRGPSRGHRLVRRGPGLLGGVHRRRGGARGPRDRRVTVTRTATIADVGKAINPQLVERQDEGATMQGIGNALFEEMVFERRAAA